MLGRRSRRWPGAVATVSLTIDFLASIAAWIALAALVAGALAFSFHRRRLRDDQARLHEQRLRAYTEFLAAGMQMFAAKAI